MGEAAGEGVLQLLGKQVGTEPPSPSARGAISSRSRVAELVDGSPRVGGPSVIACARSRLSDVPPWLGGAPLGLRHALVDQISYATELGQRRLGVEQRHRTAGHSGERGRSTVEELPRPPFARGMRSAVLPRREVASEKAESRREIDIAQRIPRVLAQLRLLNSAESICSCA
jgi:hypothetical protein